MALQEAAEAYLVGLFEGKCTALVVDSRLTSMFY